MAAATVKLFDAHCHIQDPRIFSKVPKIIETAINSCVVRFAVNGVSEKDWGAVKQMGETYPSFIPCFGLHPWSRWSLRSELRCTQVQEKAEVEMKRSEAGI